MTQLSTQMPANITPMRGTRKAASMAKKPDRLTKGDTYDKPRKGGNAKHTNARPMR